MTGYPMLDIFLSMLWFFLWFLWILLLFWIFADIFRSRDLSGWAKTAWVIFVLFVPYLGVFVYLIARGGSMHERQAKEAEARDAEFRQYVRDAAKSDGDSKSDELAKLAGLHDRGVLNDDEFQRAKQRIL